MTTKSHDCKYCQNFIDNGATFKEQRNIDKGYELRLVDLKNTNYYVRFKGYNNTNTVHANYCAMCGRKFSVKEG